MMNDEKLNCLNEKLKMTGLALGQGDSGLFLTDGKLSISVDFKELLPRLKQSNLQGEMLVKAARIKGQDMPQTIIDATA
ncbi:MAG: hypothetical protein IJ675_00030, partial [Pseudobutyrivibrio sp.]|nr:hypothetical protein [Pseudobutyrivibrio sp.]